MTANPARKAGFLEEAFLRIIKSKFAQIRLISGNIGIIYGIIKQA
jgi:hypothetical protein